MKKLVKLGLFFIIVGNLFSQTELYVSTSVTSVEKTFSFLHGVVVQPEDYLADTTIMCQSKIKKIVEDVYKKNFNSIILVVRKDGYVIYKSSYSPQLSILKKKFDETDLIKFILSETKKYELKLFVLMDLLKITKNVNTSWLCKTDSGEIFTPYCLSLGNPEVQNYIRNVVKEFLYLYPEIYGIIFDNVCYPSNKTSYDNISLYRFYTRGNPELLEYEDYQREQLNKLVNDIFSEIKRINNELLVGIFVQPEYKTPSTLTGGYYKNFQDTKKWIENNLCDFVLTKVSTKTFNLVENLTKVVPKSKLVISLTDKTSFPKIDKLTEYYGVLYQVIPETTTLSYIPKVPCVKEKPNMITGIVLDENLTPLTDAWVTLYSSVQEKIGFTLTSYDGYFSFVNITTQPVSLTVEYPYAEKVYISGITFDTYEIKFVTVTLNASSESKKLFFYIHQPKEFLQQKQFNKDIIHLLGRTYPEYKISLFTETTSTQAKVYPTGIFVFDNIKLVPGENKFVFTISDKQQNFTTQQEFVIIYNTQTPVLPPPVEKEVELLLPTDNDVLLFSGDVLEIKLKTQKNKTVYAVWSESLPKILLEETSPGIYEKKYKMPENLFSLKTKLKFELVEEKPFLWLFKKKTVKVVVPEKEVYIELWNTAYPLVGETVSEKTAMSYGLHYVRLGGPYITELPKGVKLNIVGKQQNKYKIKLSASLSGWVDCNDVVLRKDITTPIHNFFTYCSISSENNMDKIWVPWVQQVPFSVIPVVEGNKNYIVIDFFNTHLATTWLTYKSTAKILDNFKAVQVEDDHVQLKIPVKTKQLWGFKVETSTAGVIVYVRYPPKIYKDNPLKNIIIALEAGHGGDTNTGAVGLSGSKEKNINLRAVTVLKHKLENHAAKVVLMREGDTNPDFKQRIQTAINNNACIIISIHGNAGSTDKGFLRVSGTSVYYKYDNCKLLAECVYNELLKLWKDDFGLVGNFNYTPLRQTFIPAILVEQGFLTHPYDEARMLDKNFLNLQAERIVAGIKKFLSLVAEE